MFLFYNKNKTSCSLIMIMLTLSMYNFFEMILLTQGPKPINRMPVFSYGWSGTLSWKDIPPVCYHFFSELLSDGVKYIHCDYILESGGHPRLLALEWPAIYFLTLLDITAKKRDTKTNYCVNLTTGKHRWNRFASPALAPASFQNSSSDFKIVSISDLVSLLLRLTTGGCKVHLTINTKLAVFVQHY